jgi:hypothetical protein
LENDLWTFTNPRIEKNKMSVGDTLTVEDSIQHQRLAWGTALCRGESMWWFDLTHSHRLGREVSNYSDPAIQQELARQFNYFELLFQSRGGSAAEIALVIDEAGKDALSLRSKLFLQEVYDALTAWSWCGAPFDVWLADDVSPETMKPYKLVYLFAPVNTPTLQSRLREGLISPERTLWLAPGTELEDAGLCAAVIRQPCAGKSAEDLACIAAGAGVHLYGKAPLQVWASENLVVVHNDAEAKIEVDFKGGGSWREFFGGEWVDGPVDFKEHDVRLFERILER